MSFIAIFNQNKTKTNNNSNNKKLNILDSREWAMNSHECSGQSKSMPYVNSLLYEMRVFLSVSGEGKRILTFNNLLTAMEVGAWRAWFRFARNSLEPHCLCSPYH